MECLEIQPNIGSYIDRELADLEMGKIGNHLQECEKCASIRDQLNEIEGLINDRLYGWPAEQYWLNLPRTISKRIGLIPKKSVLGQLSNFVDDLFAVPKFRWALAGAVAFLLILFVAKQTFVLDTQTPAATTEIDTEPQPQSDLPVIVADSAEPSFQANSTPDAKTQPPLEIPVALKEQIAQNEILIDANPVEPLAVRRREFSVIEYEKELIPIPNSPFTLQLNDMASQSIDGGPKTNIESLALDQRIDTSKKMTSPLSFEEEPGDQNSFTEIMTIVEESPALGEKRNILLSYISRESNSTYRTLAVYHLAVVLYDIAEKAGDKDQTMEALLFFKKHENSLRAQLGENGFGTRINALDLILLE